MVIWIHYQQKVFGQILSLLSNNDILNCRLVCRSWRDDPSMFLVLSKCHKTIHFRTNNDIKYFSWLMRATPASQVPFSKFAFRVDDDIQLKTIEDFLKTTPITQISFVSEVEKKWSFRLQDLKLKSRSWGRYYGRPIQTLLFTTSNLTSLYLVVSYGTTFPATTDASCAQAFGNLRKFKVKFTLNDDWGRDSTEPAMFQDIIKHSPHLQVLSLHYYPYFCQVHYIYPGIHPLALRNIEEGSDYHEQIMRRTELQKLPNMLSHLRSSSTKVKLRLGVITNKFEDVFNELVTLTPQPRIVALAISLPPILNVDLKASIWNWIQTFPLAKLKFFQNSTNYDDVPDLDTNPFYTVHQLRLTSVTDITSNNAHFLFPNVKKLTVDLAINHSGPKSFHPDFYTFNTLLKHLPHLESLKLRGWPWEVLTGEPCDYETNEFLGREYVLQRIRDFQGKGFGIDENQIGELSKLKELEIQLIFGFTDMYHAVYASATGRLKRLQRLTFVTHDELPCWEDNADMEDATNLLREYHDKVLIINEVITF